MKPPGEAAVAGTVTAAMGGVSACSWVGVFSIVEAYPGDAHPPVGVLLLFIVATLVGIVSAGMTGAGICQTAVCLHERRRR